MRRLAGVVSALLIFLICAEVRAEIERRVALVIGNGDYAHLPRLANPANDARLMAATLERVGFQLIGGKAQTDLDRAGFERNIRQFGAELASGAVGLFYYAGHGLQVQGANFLVPIAANPMTTADVDFELIDANVVLKQMETAGSKLNIIVLDACRNNPFGGRGLRDAGAGLAPMRAPRGTLISYATQPGNVAMDGTTGHSPYTAALAASVNRPGLALLEVFNSVALAVDKDTAGRQQPWTATSPLEGDFYFLRPKAGIIALEVTPETALLRLDGQQMGQANGFRKEVPGGTHEYEIAAEGYETHHGTVAVQAGGEKSMVIALTSIAKPAPPPPPRTTGTLELEVTTPAAALLKLDGKDVGSAKGFRQEVTAGRHDMLVYAEGFEPQRQNVIVPAGGEKSLVISLAPVAKVSPPPPPPTTGLLELQVSTPGALVRLDGKQLGLAKGFRRELPVGEHELEILAEGYEPAKQSLTITPGVERSITISLLAMPKPNPQPAPTPAPQKERSVLVISTDPATAVITVDGVRQPRAGSAQLDVTPGDHVVIAGGQGLIQQQLKVHVAAGERVQVPLQIARIPPAQPRAVAQPRVPTARNAREYEYAPAATRPVEPAQTYRPPPVSVAPAAPQAPSPSAKCFTFQGRQFCE